jgi:hypothetical protein
MAGFPRRLTEEAQLVPRSDQLSDFGETTVMNPTHGTFDDIVASATPELRAISKSLRRVIASLHKDFVEVVWPRQKIASFGVGPKKMTEHYAYIAVLGSHVNLGFYHAGSLTDPSGLLEGTGKNLRHIKLRDVTSAKRPEIAALLREAIADRERYAAKA